MSFKKLDTNTNGIQGRMPSILEKIISKDFLSNPKFSPNQCSSDHEKTFKVLFLHCTVPVLIILLKVVLQRKNFPRGDNILLVKEEKPWLTSSHSEDQEEDKLDKISR